MMRPTLALRLLALPCLAACGGDVPSRNVDVSDPMADALPAAETPPRVLIIGIDGADLRRIGRLSAEGRVPHLTELMSRGVAAELATVSNASPIIWTSVATGVRPEKHGIEFFRKDGKPAASTMRRRPALWNILSHYGHTVGILAWWATFPAEEVNGYLVSPYVLLMPPRGTETRVGRLWEPGDLRKTYPPELQNELAELMYTEEDLDLSAVDHLYADPHRTTNTAWVLAKDYSYYRMTLHQLRNDPVETVAVYFQGVDACSHDFDRWVHGPNINRKRPPKVGPEEVAAATARVDAMYDYDDELVGGLLAHASPETDVIVLSDHGWQYDGTSHWNNDPGVFIAAGPSFVPGAEVEGMSVIDVTPIVLTILGVPLSRDFDGEVPEGLLRDELVDSITRVDDYPVPAVATTERAEGLAPEDEMMVERLRNLGYVR